MIRLILIFLILFYVFWIIYRLFLPLRNKQTELPMRLFMIILFALLIGVSLFFIIPKIGLITQKLILLFTNPLGFFQILIQKILPLINLFRGILPI